MIVVIALGGNALIRRGERADAAVQRANIATAAESIAKVARDHQVVVTHGNGPQVGLLALQSAAVESVSPYPLDVLGAESEGMIGYMIEQELSGRIADRRVATLLTQVVVDLDDPAFSAPTKPIGPVYPETEARRIAGERGWAIAPDNGGFRRVVPSPRPRSIVEIETIRVLVEAGVVVVCAGGGGVPVAISEDGAIRGVEAVIDKDRSAALLAEKIGAEALLILTDVPAVYTGWGTPDAQAVRTAAPDALRGYAFAEGSMGPKVESACGFVESGGTMAGIGALTDALAILHGDAGTTIRPGPDDIEWYATDPGE